jgi:hypothetical protein
VPILQAPLSGRRSKPVRVQGWACPSIDQTKLYVNNYLRQDTSRRQCVTVIPCFPRGDTLPFALAA